MAARGFVLNVAGGATDDVLGTGRPPEGGDIRVQKVRGEEGPEGFLQGIYTEFYILQLCFVHSRFN